MLKIDVNEARRIDRHNKRLALEKQKAQESRARLRKLEEQKTRKICQQILKRCEAEAYKGVTAIPFEKDWSRCRKPLITLGMMISDQKNPERISCQEVLDKATRDLEHDQVSLDKSLPALVRDGLNVIRDIRARGYQSIDLNDVQDVGFDPEVILSELKSLHRRLGLIPINAASSVPEEDVREGLRYEIRRVLAQKCRRVMPSELELWQRQQGAILEKGDKVAQLKIQIESMAATCEMLDWSGASRDASELVRRLRWLAKDARNVFQSLSSSIADALKAKGGANEVQLSVSLRTLKIGAKEYKLPKYIEIEWLLELECVDIKR